jgi:threonine dehydrogenase-like Zn-dependent dehydrogenase
MKACMVTPGDPSTAAVEDIGEPAVADGGILVEGLLVGVCGTDVEIAEKGYGVPPPGHKRLVLFHESLGRVLEAPASAALRAGDLVVGIVRRPDPVPCACCAAGEWDFCRNGQYTERGIKARDGYGCERWRVDEQFAVPVPAELGDLGVLTEPASVVAKAWDQIERIGARACFAPEHVLVTGAGPIGLLAALMGRQRGLEVTVLDRVTDGRKPELVRDLDAAYYSGALDDLPCRPDIVIECTGVGQLVFDLLTRTAPNAITCLTGLSSGTRTLETAADAVNKALVLDNDVVVGSVNANRRHYDLAVTALAHADRSWLARLVTRRVPMAEWPSALARGSDDVKVVVDLQAG